MLDHLPTMSKGQKLESVHPAWCCHPHLIRHKIISLIDNSRNYAKCLHGSKAGSFDISVPMDRGNDALLILVHIIVKC